MEFIKTKINNCFVIRGTKYNDERGYFSVTFNKEELLAKIGHEDEFIQDNMSYSSHGVIRGLHYQESPFAQTKLVRCVKGVIMDVIVDINPRSSTFGLSEQVFLVGGDNEMVYIPKGCAHGFSVISDDAIVEYKVDAPYKPELERGIIYNDPFLNIGWGFDFTKAIVSEKDLKLPTFEEVFGKIKITK